MQAPLIKGQTNTHTDIVINKLPAYIHLSPSPREECDISSKTCVDLVFLLID